MAITKENIIKALSTVEEPDLKKDLVTLNMIKDVVVDGNKVQFTVVLTTPACPLKELIKQRCVEAITRDCGEMEVTIDMTADVMAAKNLAPNLPNVKNIIAVASGKGGVGKSTVTTNLAVALAKTGARVGVIDADISGPSIPTMFNIEGQKPGMMEEDGKSFILPIRQYGVDIISIGLLTDPDQAVVWRGPMASSALRQFIGDCKWHDLDYLLFDLPPGTSDIHLTLVQSVPVTGAVIVTTPQKVALDDAVRGVSMFKQDPINVPILGVIENMSWFTPEELPDNKYYLFGQGGGAELAKKFDTELIGQIPLVQGVREGGDSGKPIVLENNIISKAFDDAASRLAQLVAIRNANEDSTKRVELKL